MTRILSGKAAGISALIIAICLLPFPAERTFAQAATHRDSVLMKWWADAHFGMFIHWGIYSVPAHAEWYMNDGHIPKAEYEQYAREFDPAGFNAERWVEIARDAGMKYLVITSKHHDGFCMFDTRATKYNVVRDTPWHEDPLKALSDACRKYGVHFGVYYSIMDWHSSYQVAAEPNKEHPTYNPTHFKRGDKGKYIEYMKTQLKELVTQYHPQVLWFDGEWMDGWTDNDGREIYRYLKRLNPNIIVNNRVNGAGDYETPEQTIPANGIPGRYWETCMTINNSWGYNASDHDFKPAKRLVRDLIDIVSKGGNYLLNVGPTAQGVIPRPEVDRLDTMGAWLKVNGDAIYGTTASPFTIQLPWGRCTQKPGKLFLEVFNWPADGRLFVPGVYNKPVRAFILSDENRSPLKVEKEGVGIDIGVPSKAPDAISTVLELDFSGQPVVYNPPRIEFGEEIFMHSVQVAISPVRNLVTRYEVDGSAVTDKSPVYSRPVRVSETTTISARYFLNGKPVSEAATVTITKVHGVRGVAVKDVSNGVRYKYCRGKWSSVPDFSSIAPEREGVLPEIVLPEKRAPSDFGIEYTGYIYIQRDGIYTFYTNSDDGSRLYIGDSLVVNNDYEHAQVEKEGMIGLVKGYHPIRVAYFQAGGGDALKVEYRGPGIEKRAIPESVLYFRK